jgi:asparagine synthetase B (glutamine-hydrolysing)
MIPKPRFEALPWLVRQGAVTALGWKNRRRRYGDEYKKWIKFLGQSNDWSVSNRLAWQRSTLLSLIELARAGTIHYARSLPLVEDLEKSETLEELLLRLPVLEKKSLRSHAHEFRNGEVAETVVTSTSGSTGSPIKVGHDDLSLQRRFAFLNDHLRLAGIEITDPSVRLSGRIFCDVGKIRDGQGKWALRQVLYQHVPREMIERPKVGFAIPIGIWLRGPLRDWAEELLSPERLAKDGFFDPEIIRQTWAEHLSGRRDWSARIWTILMFQAWHAQWA